MCSIFDVNEKSISYLWTAYPFESVNEQNSSYLEDERMNLDIELAHPILVTKWGEHGTQIDCRLEYSHDPDFIRSIPVYPGAKEFVRSLSEIAEIFIASLTR